MTGCCLLVLGLWFWVVVVVCCLGLDCLFGGLRLRLRRVKYWCPCLLIWILLLVCWFSIAVVAMVVCCVSHWYGWVVVVCVLFALDLCGGGVLWWLWLLLFEGWVGF